MEEVRVGLIGCGGMGMGLAKSLNSLEGARIEAVCDLLEEKRSKAKEELSVNQAVEDYRALLDSPDVDAVIVATPNYLHKEMVIQAANAKKHIFTEKPMAFTVSDCDAMIEAARSANVKLMVGQVLRYIGPYAAMREVIASGELGKPCSMEISRVAFWGNMQQWRFNKAQCGGILYEVSVHELDFMATILGEPKSVYAQTHHFFEHQINFEDDIFAIYRFKDGGMGQLHASFATTEAKYNGKILCEKGSIYYGHAEGEVLVTKEDGKPQPLDSSHVPDAIQRELREFTEAVRNDTEPAIPGAVGRRAILMAQGAYLSAETGQVVSLDTIK